MRHEKVTELSDGVFRTWIKILADGSEQSIRWRFASLKHAASVTGRPTRHLRELIRARLIDQAESGELWVHDWRQWQDRYESDFAPRTGAEHSANTPPTLPLELRGEKREVDEEEDVGSHPKSLPPSGRVAAGAAGRPHGDPRPTIVPDDVRLTIAGLPTDLSARPFHDALQAALSELGFACDREVRVGDRGDGRPGRLDLVAERDGVRIAFELDDRSPREKSVTKLRSVTGAARVIVLRCPFSDKPQRRTGIDAVIGAGGRANGAAHHDEPLQAVDLAPVTPGDVAIWNQALGDLASGMTASNATSLGELVPIGRAPDGGLHLRAPPGLGSMQRFRNHVARALLDAGDAAGPRVAIAEARSGSLEG
jgi:hypothetical protein